MSAAPAILTYSQGVEEGRRLERERIAVAFDVLKAEYERKVVEDYAADSVTAALLTGAFSRAASIARTSHEQVSS